MSALGRIRLSLTRLHRPERDFASRRPTRGVLDLRIEDVRAWHDRAVEIIEFRRARALLSGDEDELNRTADLIEVLLSLGAIEAHLYKHRRKLPATAVTKQKQDELITQLAQPHLRKRRQGRELSDRDLAVKIFDGYRELFPTPNLDGLRKRIAVLRKSWSP
jgi:hypothetical protein